MLSFSDCTLFGLGLGCAHLCALRSSAGARDTTALRSKALLVVRVDCFDKWADQTSSFPQHTFAVASQQTWRTEAFWSETELVGVMTSLAAWCPVEVGVCCIFQS